MNKFIGEMTYEEFVDALKVIIRTKIPKAGAQNDSDDKVSFKEKLNNAYKYIVTFGIIKDFWQMIIECVKYIKCLFSKQFLIDIKQNIINFAAGLKSKETEIPELLTKEVFIEKGLKFKTSFLDIMDTVVFVIVMVIIIRFCIGEIRWIPSGSMHPTLLEGDRIFVERFSRFYTTPKRGDIMVFYPPMEQLKRTPWKVFSRLTGFFCKDIAYIKRVIALPGEKFELKVDDMGKYTVYINDKPIDEPYIMSPYDYKPCTSSMTCGPIVLGDDQYMMMGDNRGDSLDSRYWGTLKQDRFIGKAVYLFWPFKRAKSLIYKNPEYK